MKTRKTHFSFPVLNNYTVRVIVVDKISEAMSRYPRLKEFAEDYSDKEARVFSCDSHHCYIFLPTDASVRTIVHECWHVVKTMMKYVDIALDQETVAYHMGYLTQKVYDFVHRR